MIDALLSFGIAFVLLNFVCCAFSSSGGRTQAHFGIYRIRNLIFRREIQKIRSHVTEAFSVGGAAGSSPCTTEKLKNVLISLALATFFMGKCLFGEYAIARAFLYHFRVSFGRCAIDTVRAHSFSHENRNGRENGTNMQKCARNIVILYSKKSAKISPKL